MFIELLCSYIYLCDDIHNILSPQISVGKESPNLSRLRTAPKQTCGYLGLNRPICDENPVLARKCCYCDCTSKYTTRTEKGISIMHPSTMGCVCPGTRAFSAMHYGRYTLCKSANGGSLAIETLYCNEVCWFFMWFLQPLLSFKLL